jgi:hypothetical protein
VVRLIVCGLAARQHTNFMPRRWNDMPGPFGRTIVARASRSIPDAIVIGRYVIDGHRYTPNFPGEIG